MCFTTGCTPAPSAFHHRLVSIHSCCAATQNSKGRGMAEYNITGTKQAMVVVDLSLVTHFKPKVI
jgi:hypothetical protein